jgi:hypothetical protein
LLAPRDHDPRSDSRPIRSSPDPLDTRLLILEVGGTLAELYRVPTRRLNEQVTRNISRFPQDFMFQLKGREADALRSQIATSKERRGGRRYLPRVFTEQGVAMLSSIPPH